MESSAHLVSANLIISVAKKQILRLAFSSKGSDKRILEGILSLNPIFTHDNHISTIRTPHIMLLMLSASSHLTAFEYKLTIRM
jgi:hypothetical protein